MSAEILHFFSMIEAPNRIRELRMQAKLSQQALGDAIGVSKVTISDLERGTMHLTVDYMRRLAPPLNVDPADILSRSDNPLSLTPTERDLLERFRSADEQQQDQLHRVAEALIPYKGPDSEAA